MTLVSASMLSEVMMPDEINKLIIPALTSYQCKRTQWLFLAT